MGTAITNYSLDTLVNPTLQYVLIYVRNNPYYLFYSDYIVVVNIAPLRKCRQHSHDEKILKSDKCHRKNKLRYTHGRGSKQFCCTISDSALSH